MSGEPQPAQENKMGVMPVHRLLLTMSGPMMISMFIQALYNVVDSMFVSYISEAALTAVSLAYPMQNLMIAVATGTGVGINALLSRNLGEKNFTMANRTASNAIFLGLVSSVVFALVGLFGSRIYFAAQVTDPEIIALGQDYLSIIMILAIGCFGQVLLSRLLQSTGKTFYSMVIQMVGAGLNIILDPIMIFGLNQILVAFSETATAVYGVYFKLQGFAFLPIIGMNNGMVPIIAYNYGARKPDRILQTIRLAITYAVCIMVVAVIIFQVFPVQLLGFFQASQEMLDIGVPALRTLSLCFLIGGFTIVSSSVFQALGKGLLSMSISVFRQLVLVLPLAYVFSLTGKLEMVWWAFPVAEVLAGILAGIYLRRAYLRVICPLAERDYQF